MKITGIAFDLARVFLNIKDVEVTPREFELSQAFDYKVGDELYWDWATKLTGLSEEKTKELCWKIINKRYELREPDIFSELPKLKFATASNHLSMIKDWLKEKGVYDNFHCHVISEDVKCQKPSQKFYEILVKRLDEKPENILFIDDKVENIEGAEKMGMQTLLYDGKELLSKEIMDVLRE